MPTERKYRTRAESLALQKKVANFLDAHPGAKNSEVAAALEVTVSVVTSVRVKIKRTGKRTAAQMDDLCARYKKFLRDNPKARGRIAAEALGLSSGMIAYIRKRIGVAPKRSAKARDRLKTRIRRILIKQPELSNRELASLVKKPKTTVVTIRSELGLSRDANEAREILFLSVAQQVRQIVKKEGLELTDEKLAKRLDVSLRTVSRWRKKLGIQSWKHRRYKVDEEYFRQLWSDGWSDTEIAEIMRCSHQRVQKWRYRNGLVANVIHDSIRKDSICRSHTPTTLIDIIGTQMENEVLDSVWAFAALGADREWLCKRFPHLSEGELDEVIEHLLKWKIPRNLKRIVRRSQLIKDE
jgi:transposase